ncbi:MAG: polymerase sigma-70 factor, subfamily [Chloroflexota bacterium]|jgi:RNA polymerase sigma-70 factor (ECF subfamily)|nr:polymerase sigma-70 factor, subfamily [Chloroflexota bacterium]
MDDGQLLQRCRDGDGEAFASLLERHQGACFGLALRILGDREDAMDALQDSCVKAWRAIGDMHGDAFGSWMSSIVARTCVDRIRARRPSIALEDDEGRVIPLPDPQPGPESVALSRDRVRAIELSLSRLTPEHRAIVLMRDLSGLSYEEIALALELPIGTVRSRLARARTALQAELLRQDPGILEAFA